MVAWSGMSDDIDDLGASFACGGDPAAGTVAMTANPLARHGSTSV